MFKVVTFNELLNRAGNAQGMRELLAREGSKLPEDFLEKILELRSACESIFLIKNLPVVPKGCEVPDTPDQPKNITEEQKRLLLYAPIVALLNGVMHLKPQRQVDGHMRFSHVIPKEPDAEREVFATNRPLSLHVDGMAHEIVPAVGILSCVRGQEIAKTFFTKVDDILNELSHETIQALKEPNFGFAEGMDLRRGSPFTGSSSDYVELPYSMLDGNILRYSQSSTGQTDSADQALSALREAVNGANKISVALESGDLLLWRNDLYMHGRSAYEYKEGKDAALNRWVVRNMSFIDDGFQHS